MTDVQHAADVGLQRGCFTARSETVWEMDMAVGGRGFVTSQQGQGSLARLHSHPGKTVSLGWGQGHT